MRLTFSRPDPVSLRNVKNGDFSPNVRIYQHHILDIYIYIYNLGEFVDFRRFLPVSRVGGIVCPKAAYGSEMTVRV